MASCYFGGAARPLVSRIAPSLRYSTSTVPKSARVVVCGGGVIGTSVAYHLAERGRKDVVLLEQGKLTCGTTWHSVGLIGQVRDTTSYTKYMKYSRQLYTELEEKHGVGWKQCGSLSLAQTKDRLIDLKRKHALAKASDVESYIVGPSEVRKLCDIITMDDILGGLWIPSDGALTAPDLVSAFAKEAKAKGVKIFEDVKINNINTKNGQVSSVETSHGSIECQVFVNCAGQWARTLALKSDPPVNIPFQPMEHFYIVTTPVKGTERMPVIRDYDGRVYAREWSGGLLLGGFEKVGKPAFLDGIPDKFEFQLFPEDWEHFQCLLDSISKRFPLMETAQIRQQINGPETFTPDGNWNVGEAPNVKNYYVAAGMMSFGIAGAGAIGRHLSEQIIDGETTLDVPSIDMKRHSEYYNGQTFLQERGKEVIGRFRINYPGLQFSSGRNLEVSPLHDKMEDAGACFGQDCAFEKPLWFNTKSEKPFDQYTSQRDTFGKPSWFDEVRDEYSACKQAVGLIDASNFSQVAVWSKDDEAYDYLQWLSSSDIPRDTGSTVLTGMQNQRGGYECQCLVVPQAKNRFFVCIPSSQKTRLLHWLERNLPDNNDIQIYDVTSSYTKLILIGPRARDLLSEVSRGSFDQTLTKNTRKVLDIGVNSGVQIIRQSWCGEDGYFLFIPSQCSSPVYNSIMATGQQHGIQHVGHIAMKQLQVENFYPQWLHELGTKVTPIHAGLSETLELQKKFLGRDAIIEQKETALNQQLVQLAVTNFLPDKQLWVWGGEPVYLGDVCVGSVSSSGYSFNSNTMYCLAFVKQTTDAHQSTGSQDATYHISVSGETYEAKITSIRPNTVVHEVNY